MARTTVSIAIGIVLVGLSVSSTSDAQAVSAAAPLSAAPPNLLLVTLDTTRADRFSAWGRRDGLAARIDRLASEGVVFSNCIAPTGTTKPSHASIFTGLYPRSHGVVSNALGLSPEIQTAAGILSAAGYDTGAFVSFAPLLGTGGIAQGFEHQSVGPRSMHVRPGLATTMDAVRWLKGISASRLADGRPSVPGGGVQPRPFFAWVHYFDVHSPYDATAWSEALLKEYCRSRSTHR